MADKRSSGRQNKKRRSTPMSLEGQHVPPYVNELGATAALLQQAQSGQRNAPTPGEGQSLSNVESKENSQFALDCSVQSDSGAEGTVRGACSELLMDQVGNLSLVQASSSSAAVGDTPKSKAQLRAERRATQEAQRAMKAANKSAGGAVGAAHKGSDGKSARVVEGKQQVRSENTAQMAGTPGTKKATDGKGQSSGSGTHASVKKPVLQTGAAIGPKDAKIRIPDSMQADDEKVVRRQSKKLDKQRVPQRPTVGQKKVRLFGHLVQNERKMDWTHEFQQDKTILDPSVRQLGLWYVEGTVCGSNARCIALLMVLRKVINEYRTPPNCELSRDLEIHLRPIIGFLNQCRPLSVSMGNAIKYLKHQISQIPSDETDSQAKQTLLKAIDEFIRTRILLAGEAISNETCSSIRDGDVILVYSCSSLVQKVLQDAHKKGVKFTVIVADGRPMLEGQIMLHRLIREGIKCSYVLISAVSYVMQEVTKVLLGAHALLANGFVMSRVGSSQVALIAKTYNVPVLVCCETYKFCERVQTDSFVFNELGDPDDLVTVNNGILSVWRSLTPLHILNLVYDVTPPELLSTVITELGSIPSTSVPVVLRVKYSES